MYEWGKFKEYTATMNMNNTIASIVGVGISAMIGYVTLTEPIEIPLYYSYSTFAVDNTSGELEKGQYVITNTGQIFFNIDGKVQSFDEQEKYSLVEVMELEEQQSAGKKYVDVFTDGEKRAITEVEYVSTEKRVLEKRVLTRNAEASIAVINSASVHTDYVNSITLGLDCSTDADRGVVVAVGNRTLGDITGITYNGTALTREARALNNNVAGVDFWALKSASSSSNNVVLSNSQYRLHTMYAVCLSGTNQSDIVEVYNVGGTNGTALTQATTSVSNNTWFMSAINLQGAYALTPDSGETELFDEDNSDANLGQMGVSYYEKASAGSETLGWSWSTTDNAQMALIAVKPSESEYVVDTSARSTDFGEPGSNIVWTSTSTAYLFYQDTLRTSMASTTDGGMTWSAPRDVDSVNTVDGISSAVFWDGWNSSSTRYIHIATLDYGVDDLYYTRLDLTTGAFATTVLATTQSASMNESVNYAAITMGKNGVLYMAAADASDSFVVSCATDCTNTANWSEVSGGFQDNGEDIPLLLPVSGTDNVLLVYWDTGAKTIDYDVWSATSSGWWFTTDKSIKTSVENVTSFYNYKGQMMSGAYSTSTGLSYISFIDDADDYTGEDHDINVYSFSSSTWSWTALTNPVTNASGGLSGAKISVETESKDLYVSYLRKITTGTTTYANVYYKRSTDGGSTWSAESSPINLTADNFYLFNTTPTSRYQMSVVYKYISTPRVDDLYSKIFWTEASSSTPATPSGMVQVQSEFFF